MYFKYREVRRTKGLTLEDAAKPIGRTKQWLSEVERGNIRLAFDEAVKLAQVYGETPDIFLPNESDNFVLNEKSNIKPHTAA